MNVDVMIKSETLTVPQTPLSRQPANLPHISRRFEGRAAQELLRWGLATYGDDIALATGFGPSGVVLMHMVSQLRPETTVFYLQTDLLFAETLALRDQLAARLGLRFREIHCALSLDDQRRQYGPELWRHNPDLCCRLRKVVPLRRFLAGQRAWIAGIRRDQSPARAATPLVGWDHANQVVKLNPLAFWTDEQVWAYIGRYHLPYNSLHDAGYPSLGCVPCTRAVAPGEDARAGRWPGQDKIECGIHIQPDGRLRRRVEREEL